MPDDVGFPVFSILDVPIHYAGPKQR
jgi:hypothetical protein